MPLTDANLNGRWPVLVFYPADFTVMCPAELGDLADYYAEFQKMGVEICGVSTDTPCTHKAWHGNSDTLAKVRYPLVGDPTPMLRPKIVRLAAIDASPPPASRNCRQPGGRRPEATRISCCTERTAAMRGGRLQQRVSERRQVFFK